MSAPFAEPVSLADALAATEGSPRDLILGNGFSIAYDPGFIYENLYERANLSDRLRAIFRRLETSDFETVIRWLADAKALLPPYGATAEQLEVLDAEIRSVRHALIDALTTSHPDHVYAVPAPEIENASAFLRNFDAVFSVCYDLLLYWVKIRLGLDDGFRWHADSAAPLVWIPERPRHVHWLHGGFHLFERAGSTFKYRSSTGVGLINQVREDIASGGTPLFVAEGRWEDKLKHILARPYLKSCLEALGATDHVLFVHGMALQVQDQHILQTIEEGSATLVYVGLYVPDATGASRVRIRAAKMPAQRDAWRAGRNLEPLPLEIRFYDSSTCTIWR